jgi:hypothetical protein
MDSGTSGGSKDASLWCQFIFNSNVIKRKYSTELGVFSVYLAEERGWQKR